MKPIYEAFETDPELEKDGVWFDFGDFGRMKLARAGGANQAFSSKLAAAYRPYRRQLELGALPEDKAKSVLQTVFADTVVKGFEFVDRDGHPIEFNRGNVLKLFVDLPDLFDWAHKQANEMAAYRKGEVEAIVKNS